MTSCYRAGVTPKKHGPQDEVISQSSGYKYLFPPLTPNRIVLNFVIKDLFIVVSEYKSFITKFKKILLGVKGGKRYLYPEL